MEIIILNQLTLEELNSVSGAGLDESVCVASFGALGALGGFIGGGIASAGIGMGAGAIWGFGFGTQIGTAVCIP